MSSWFRETPETRDLLAQERLVVEAAELINDALEQRGVTRAQLAEALGVRASEVSQRLSGRRNMTLRSFASMLHQLGYRPRLTLIDDRRALLSTGPLVKFTIANKQQVEPEGTVYSSPKVRVIA